MDKKKKQEQKQKQEQRAVDNSVTGTLKSIMMYKHVVNSRTNLRSFLLVYLVTCVLMILFVCVCMQGHRWRCIRLDSGPRELHRKRRFQCHQTSPGGCGILTLPQHSAQELEGIHSHSLSLSHYFMACVVMMPSLPSHPRKQFPAFMSP